MKRGLLLTLTRRWVAGRSYLATYELDSAAVLQSPARFAASTGEEIALSEVSDSEISAALV